MDVRLICASNRNLAGLVEEEKFREDLFYRINTFTIDIPPLKERRDDIPLLASYFLQVYAEKNKKDIAGIAPAAVDLLKAQEWKGNVRELEHVIERATILAAGSQIEVEDLPQNMRGGDNGNGVSLAYMDMPFKEAKECLVEDFEKRYIATVLAKYEMDANELGRQGPPA